MNNKYKNILLACMAVSTFAACDDETTLGSLPEAVPMSLSMSNKYLAFGESTELVMTVTQPEEGELALNEDIDIEYTLQCKDADGNEIPYSEVFDGFVEKVSLAQGEKQTAMTLSAKSNKFKLPITSVLTAFSRGYVINGSKQEFSLSDYHYTTVSFKGNSDKAIWEGEGFILQATTTAPPVEDLVVGVEVSDEIKGQFPNIPEQITIPAGKTEGISEVIWTKDARETTADVELVLNFVSSVSSRPVSSEKIVLKVMDVDKNKGNDEVDERNVNPTPQLIYASSEEVKEAIQAWAPTKMVKVMAPGTDTHPIKPEWTFLRAMEFHYIDQCMNAENKYGNHLVKGMAAQNTAKVQWFQGLDNDKYSTVTEEGYLKMWGVKEKTIAEWWGNTAERDYGISAFYANKFRYKNGQIEMADGEAQNLYILPGMRMEFRARMNGAMNGFNNGIWLQGNIDDGAWPWPAYGEIDVVENPVGPATGGGVHATLHYWGNSDNHLRPGGSTHAPDVKEWNIYWCEIHNDKIVLGVNNSTIKTITNDSTKWPFNMEVNPTGYHILLTMLGPNNWSLNGSGSGDKFKPHDSNWDKGFANITYEQSKTHKDTPRMELDWIRFYKNADYDSNLNSSKVGPLQNKEQVFY